MDTLVRDFAVCLVVMTIWITFGNSRKEDFCEWQTFNATCRDDEVIHMEHAHYGRMSVGGCVKRDYGYIGCQVDVLSYLDHVCSGRRTCQLKLPDENLDTGRQPCPDDLDSYIQLEYSCINVYTTAAPCTREPLQVSGTNGLLANLITERTGQGGPDCPWEVRASPGQKIRLTLHDYGVWTPPTPQGGGGGRESGARQPERSGICHIYARITEGAVKSTITLCGGETKEKVVYVSETEGVQIAITDPKHSQSPAYYLLQYEVLGCPNYIPPEDAIVEEHENEISVRCPDTGSHWRLSCQETIWRVEEGEVTNCTTAGATSRTAGVLFGATLTLPQWILILIIIGIAILIAVIILTVGIVSLRRKRDTVIATIGRTGNDPEKYTPHPGYMAKEQYPMLAKHQRGRQSLREREYTTTLHRLMAVPPGGVSPMSPNCEFPPLPLPPAASFPDAGHCPVHGTPNHNRDPRESTHTSFKPPHAEHIYESPKFLRRVRSESDTSGPFYHELDPDHADLSPGSRPRDSYSDSDELGLDTPVDPPPEVFFPSGFAARKFDRV